MKLTPQVHPVWTPEALSHMLAHPDAYGVEVNETVLTEVERLRATIASGAEEPRTLPHGTRLFHVVDKDLLIGELLLTLVGGVPEISIGIYEGHDGQGYAKRAVAMVVEHLATKGYCTTEACIAHANTAKEPIRAVLSACGFSLVGNASGAELWRRTA